MLIILEVSVQSLLAHLFLAKKQICCGAGAPQGMQNMA